MSLWHSSSATLTSCILSNGEAQRVRWHALEAGCVPERNSDEEVFEGLQKGGIIYLLSSSSATLTSCTLINGKSEQVRRHTLEVECV